ncbi:MAG: HAD family phosphatase [Ferruginibacter sp.]
MAILKNIIFDLGGVLLNIDYNKTEQAFAKLGVTDFRLMYDQFSADDLFEKLETGSISARHFYETMIARDKALTIDTITNSWNAMLMDFRIGSLSFLKNLAKKYDLYLLSNTNIIHKTRFDIQFTQETGKPSIDDYFKKVYYSHLVGLRKPNDDIFEFLLKDAGIKAGETLFIDDSYNNIEAARKFGIKTHLLLAGEKVEELKIFI